MHVIVFMCTFSRVNSVKKLLYFQRLIKECVAQSEFTINITVNWLIVLFKFNFYLKRTIDTFLASDVIQPSWIVSYP